MRWLFALGGALTLGAAPPDQSAVPRQPTARWLANFHDSQCVASRDYGSAEDPLVLVLKAPPLGGIIQVGVMRRGKVGTMANQLTGEVAFDQNKPLRTSVLAFTNGKLKKRAYLINLPIADFAPARTASVISFRARPELNERFASSSLGPLMKVMDECVAGLREVWNVGEFAEAKLQHHASGSAQGLFKSDDYPAVAIAEGQSGTAHMVLLINEIGRVADCTVIATSGAALLDAQSCAVVKERARFKPAVGKDGKPAKSNFHQRITWRVAR